MFAFAIQNRRQTAIAASRNRRIAVRPELERTTAWFVSSMHLSIVGLNDRRHVNLVPVHGFEWVESQRLCLWRTSNAPPNSKSDIK